LKAGATRKEPRLPHPLELTLAAKVATDYLMINLLDELQSIAGRLDDASIEYALIGGLAFSLYVEPRATEDIDFLVCDNDDWPVLVSALAELGYRELAGQMKFANANIRRLTKIVEKDAVVLDFVLVPEREDIRSGNRLFVGSRTINVASPEVIIKLKQGRMSDKDVSDIAALKKLQR
jgi:hypothetical protein